MLVARVNYSHQKRLKDLERQRKQEEKRQRRLNKDTAPGDTHAEPSPDTPLVDTDEPQAGREEQAL